MMFQKWCTVLRRALYTSAYSISAAVVVTFWWTYGDYNSPWYQLDTDYLHWTSTVPAVSVCQAGAFNSSSWALNSRNVQEFITGLVRPRKTFCKKCDIIKNSQDYKRIPKSGYDYLTTQIVSSCEELFHSCSWNDKPFECCQRFGHIKTRKGICYSINSDITRNNMKFFVSHFAKEAMLDLRTNYPVQVFVHDPKDVGFVKDQVPVVSFGSALSLLYSSQETLAHQSAWSLTPDQLGCVLPGEGYSKTICLSECFARQQIARCRCSHHLLPNIGNTSCDFEGLRCLDYYFNNPDKHSKKELLRSRKNCQCLPSCEEIEVKVIWAKLSKNHGKIKLNIDMIGPPTERVILKARVDFLDILVGFTCFTRLFTSSSIVGASKSLLLLVYSYKIEITPSYRHILY